MFDSMQLYMTPVIQDKTIAFWARVKLQKSRIVQITMKLSRISRPKDITHSIILTLM